MPADAEYIKMRRGEFDDHLSIELFLCYAMLIELRKIEEKEQGHIAVLCALLFHEDDFFFAHGERKIIAHDVEKHALE